MGIIMSKETTEKAEKKTGINYARIITENKLRNADGTADRARVLAFISADFAKWCEVNEMGTPEIADAVKAVFAKYPEAKIQMNALVTKAQEILNTPPEACNRVADRIRLFVRGAADLYHVKKGKEGGVLRGPKPVVAGETEVSDESNSDE